MHYESAGLGPSLLLISGLSFGGWIWYRQAPAFSRHFRIICFDNRGSGFSDKPDENYTIDTFVADTVSLLDALNIDKTHIVGVSLGGMIAQKLALDYPDRVTSLVLCSTVFGGPNTVLPPMHVLQFMAQPAGTAEERFAQGVKNSFTPEFIEKNQTEIQFLKQKMSENRQPDYAYRRQVMAPLGFNVELRLTQLKMPVLVVAGGSDQAVPVENARRLAQHIPNSTLHILERAGHLCFVEEPDAFNQLVIDFLMVSNKDHKRS